MRPAPISTAASARRAAPLPPSFHIEVSAATHLIDGGLLLGGDARSVVRLDGSALRGFEALAAGAAVGDTEARLLADDAAARGLAGQLARRLVDGGYALPVPNEAGLRRDDVTVVIPVHNGAPQLPSLIASIGPTAGIVVVDDGSSDDTAAVAARLGAEVVRHPQALGPAAARNAGLARVQTSITLFIDDDALLDPGWDSALGHLEDPALGVVLPRIHPALGTAGLTRAARYELARSPYDLGAEGGPVARHARLRAGSSVVVLGRTDALREAAGFDASLRFGEDADLFWRLDDLGWRVRYDPTVGGAHHAVRSRLADLLRLHWRYGGGGAELARRHRHRSGGAMSVSAIAGTALVATGRPRLAAVSVASETALVTRGLMRAGLPPTPAARLAARWQLRSLRTVVALGTSDAAPVTLAAAAAAPRLRPLLAAAVLARHLEGWRTAGPQLDPATWVGLRIADDLAHAGGTWAGMVTQHEAGPIRPTLSRPLTDGPPCDAAAPLVGWTTIAVFQ